MIGYAYGTDLLYKKVLFKAKRGRKTRGYSMLAYTNRPAVVIKTQLVVPDNRHCNAVTLGDHVQLR